jgi:hypothetical protein
MVMLTRDVAIYGAEEAAEYLGLTREVFWFRRHRPGETKHRLLEPMWLLACGPIWTREQLDEWRRESQSPG